MELLTDSSELSHSFNHRVFISFFVHHTIVMVNIMKNIQSHVEGNVILEKQPIRLEKSQETMEYLLNCMNRDYKNLRKYLTIFINKVDRVVKYLRIKE